MVQYTVAPGDAAADYRIGRALGIMPHESNKDGVVDLELDDFPLGSAYSDLQKVALAMHSSFL